MSMVNSENLTFLFLGFFLALFLTRSIASKMKQAVSNTPVRIPLFAAAIMPTHNADKVLLRSVGGALKLFDTFFEVIRPMYSTEHCHAMKPMNMAKRLEPLTIQYAARGPITRAVKILESKADFFLGGGEEELLPFKFETSAAPFSTGTGTGTETASFSNSKPLLSVACGPGSAPAFPSVGPVTTLFSFASWNARGLVLHPPVQRLLQLERESEPTSRPRRRRCCCCCPCCTFGAQQVRELEQPPGPPRPAKQVENAPT